MKININELEWHDSEIRSIYIDRSNPGKIDEVLLEISCSNAKNYKVVFRDCYKVIFNLNMGIVSSENIFDVIFDDIVRKNQIFENLKFMKFDKNKLKYFKLETGSTGGYLEIFYLESDIMQFFSS